MVWSMDWSQQVKGLNGGNNNVLAAQFGMFFRGGFSSFAFSGIALIKLHGSVDPSCMKYNFNILS